MTYVLNTRSLKGRLFVETADGGLIEMMNNPLHFAPGQYPLGTMDSERPAMPVDFPFLCRCFAYLTSRRWADWYHIIQPHSERPSLAFISSADALST